ncbi:MAG: flagellar protein export ATPase FliI [Wenzhouxiangellaceae bacterium]|nr:flagellar protein export ATPase FliI [Wenzhouxiangellaceae bacterium]
MSSERLVQALRARAGRIPQQQPLRPSGRVQRMVGLTIEAVGIEAALGDRCWVEVNDRRIEAEVVGFAGDRVFLMPNEEIRGLSPVARVVPAGRALDAPVGDALLGRVIDGAARPLDGKGPLRNTARHPLIGEPINPLQRQPIEQPLNVGVRAINGLLTVGRGQRMGLFAGSGVGKSTLLGMMTRFTSADIVVVGLIGERGREVSDFIERTLGPEGLARAVVVATPADRAPLMRVRGAWLATAIAEYYRDQGKKVLLLMDSLTRFAQAKREIGLAVGEPPATKGYPPSVFASLPALVERAGNAGNRGGSITAFYTVLAEGDDTNDPIADAARAILDGHVVLSRGMAEAGIYPAIDLEASISRSMVHVTDGSQQELARRFRQLFAAYRQSEDLIAVGAYKRGSDPMVDEAIAYYPKLLDYLRQSEDLPIDLAQSARELSALFTRKAEAA